MQLCTNGYDPWKQILEQIIIAAVYSILSKIPAQMIPKNIHIVYEAWIIEPLTRHVHENEWSRKMTYFYTKHCETIQKSEKILKNENQIYNTYYISD